MLPKESFITQLDLGFLVRRLVDREKWAQEDAKEAVRRYKNFLILIFKYPNELLAPAPDMDEAWHAHILFTQKYTAACQEIFGGYLHHTPAEGSASEQKTMIDAQQNTSRLYRKEFNEPYSLELDVSSFW